MTTSQGVAFVPSVTCEIEAEVRRVLDTRADRVAGLGSSAADAWDLASRCLLGGKLLRPRLLIGTFDALASSPPADLDGDAVLTRASAAVGRSSEARGRAVRIAAGVELLHFAFLLHDDVIDGDLMRRGRPNFIGLQVEEWESEAAGAGTAPTSHASRLHSARSNAMLVGDMLLSAVHQIFCGEGLPEETGSRLLELLDRAVMESVSGELTDVALSDGRMRPELADIVEMSRQKTATYSFELPLRSAAVLAGVGPDAEALLGRVGALLGLAYQLQDDLLSTFGRPDEHGKDAYSDLREGKETAIIAIARRTPAWPLIEPHFGAGDLSADDGATVRSLLSECGAEREARALIDDVSSNARELASAEPRLLGPEVRLLIDELVEALDGRRS